MKLPALAALASLAAALTLGAPALAAETAPEVSPLEFCGAIRALAESSMGARQSGVPLGTALGTLADNPVRALAESILYAAYEEPDYRTEAAQRDAVTDFANDIEVVCLTELRGN